MQRTIELMIDSGAYSEFKSEGTVDLGDYIEFVKRLVSKGHARFSCDLSM